MCGWQLVVVTVLCQLLAVAYGELRAGIPARTDGDQNAVDQAERRTDEPPGDPPTAPVS